MYKLSERSINNLKKVHPLLEKTIYDVMSLQIMDFVVVEGLRTLDRQRQLFATGQTKTLKSKHLLQADGFSHAVDLYPFPVNIKMIVKGDPREMFRSGVLAGLVLSVAKRNGIIVTNGADWDMDGETSDTSFFDAPHFEIIKQEK
jgi:peptidoglycan L-alanyl-D-glutamate endopeptidase CwlK